LVALVLFAGSICIILCWYAASVRIQLHSVNRQLEERICNHSQQMLHLDLLDKELNRLAANINKCLKIEEELRIKTQSDVKCFQELIANVSHDLRTPLTAIKGYLQLTGRCRVDEEGLENLNIAVKHTNSLDVLINQFFEYSYYLCREEIPDLTRINLTNYVMECLLEFIPGFEEKAMMVVYEQESPAFVMADRDMLKRIMQNLFRNCLHYSKGDVRVEITQKDHVVLTVSNPVSDTEKIDSQRLFERFYIADKTRTSSTGLGLSIVKLFAEKMNGSVSAELVNDQLYISIHFMGMKE
jgi:signal transduction histidine kinase